MKSVCFIGSFTAGGTERITYLLVNELLARYDDLNIHVLNFKDNKPTFPLSGQCHYSCILCSGKKNIILYIRKYIKENHIDTLVNIEALVGIFTIPATLGLRCRNVVWEHANYYQTQGSRWTRLVRKIWMNYAHQYIVLTNRDLTNFLTHEKPRCKVSYIYNPISLLNEIGCSYARHSHKIISAGHLLPIKNFQCIPDIAKIYIERFSDWTWEIYGGGTQEVRLDLLNKIKRLGLEGKVILRGRSDKIDDAFNSAAIYAMTSLQEGLPTVLLEAMIHGVPCVSFDIETGPDEIIINGENGFLVPAYDVKQYADALMLLMESEERRIKFSQNTQKSLKKFNLAESVGAWRNVLSEL